MLVKATFLLGVLFALNVSALAAIVFARLLAVVALLWVVILRAALPRVTARSRKKPNIQFHCTLITYHTLLRTSRARGRLQAPSRQDQ
jgi:uncharacterized membrane protein